MVKQTHRSKIFQARWHLGSQDILSLVDVDGHDMHTSTTATCNAIVGVSLVGMAEGTARGGVPSTRVAIYKVCWVGVGCVDKDLLAAFDAAITDDVDVISISIGSNNAFRNYSEDATSIGTFHAMKRGIITVAAADNDGSSVDSVFNNASWILTVVSSEID